MTSRLKDTPSFVHVLVINIPEIVYKFIPSWLRGCKFFFLFQNFKLSSKSDWIIDTATLLCDYEGKIERKEKASRHQVQCKISDF